MASIQIEETCKKKKKESSIRIAANRAKTPNRNVCLACYQRSEIGNHALFCFYSEAFSKGSAIIEVDLMSLVFPRLLLPFKLGSIKHAQRGILRQLVKSLRRGPDVHCGVKTLSITIRMCLLQGPSWRGGVTVIWRCG